MVTPLTMTRHFLRISLGLLTAATLALPAWAQFRVEVSGVGLTQVPIAFAPLRGEEATPQKISAIVQADLERSGQFRGVSAGVVTGYPGTKTGYASEPSSRYPLPFLAVSYRFGGGLVGARVMWMPQRTQPVGLAGELRL